MWKYYIELFTDNCYGDFVENTEIEGNGLPVCSDLSVAKSFNTPDELNQWVKKNTSLNIENCDYGIKGIYYPKKKVGIK
jgi:hypothetical protein